MFEPTTPWPEQLVGHLAAFFVTALVCHQTLAARPAARPKLTEFYLCLSIGGVLGGSFNAFLAPALFPTSGSIRPSWCWPAWRARPRPCAVERRGPTWLAAGVVWIAPLLIPGLMLPDIGCARR